MIKDNNLGINMDKRTEKRSLADEHSSVEFVPEEVGVSYHFKIRDISPNGMCILVKKGSDLLNHIKVGDVMDMKFHSSQEASLPVLLKTEIKHITKPDEGRFEGHIFVGLHILGK